MDFLTDQVKKKFSDNKPENSNQGNTKPDPNKPGQTEPTNKPVSNTESSTTTHKPASNAELMASAKIVAEAAQAATRNETNKLDKAKVAGATADILDAASRYGKFDEKSGVGQYLEKAENYLHKYESSHSNSSSGGGGSGSHGGETAATGKKGEEKSGGGIGDYAKLAQGFIK
ncbi:unnamed protein product [Cochlearia groenlandica]